MGDLALTAATLLQEIGAAEPPIRLTPILAYLGLTLIAVDQPMMRYLCGSGARMPVDGLLLPESMVVAVNGEQPRSRQRFTAAHEIGEYLHRSERGSQSTALFSTRGIARGSEHERAMNNFAAHLLMPKAMVLAEWSRWQATRREGFVPRFSDLCSTFGVSKQAMNRRMRHIIAEAEATL